MTTRRALGAFGVLGAFAIALGALGACSTGASRRDVAPAPSAPVPHEPSETSSPRAAGRSSRAPLVGEYAAVWDASSGTVIVEAKLTTSAGAFFTVERGAEAFAKDVVMSADRDGAPWSPVARHGRVFEASLCAAGPCRLRYRFALRDAARKLDDLDTASEEGEVIEAPPSTWLIAPNGPPRDRRLRFRVSAREGSRFVTGVFPAPDAPGTWEISLDDLWTSPYTAFGPFRVRTVPVKGGNIQLAIGPGTVAVTDDDLVRWVDASARAVSSYYGTFPMPNALVMLIVSRGRWVGSGRTLAGGGGTVLVRIGERAQPKAYRDDWVLVHEMIHLTFPSVPRDQSWAEEGIATYAEPFARVRAGLVAEEDAWSGLVEGLPNGQPGSGDRGLDHTPTWGRTYWGGALFWFVADVEIHKATKNRLGLEHALRGINAAGGTNAMRWPLVEAFAAGDRATGTTVLTDLHAKMGAAPSPVDVDAIMKSLGVVRTSRGRVELDDEAPLAAVRRSIARGTDAPAPAP